MCRAGPGGLARAPGGPLAFRFLGVCKKNEITVSFAHTKVCDLRWFFNDGRPNRRTVSFAHMKLCDLYPKTSGQTAVKFPVNCRREVSQHYLYPKTSGQTAVRFTGNYRREVFQH